MQNASKMGFEMYPNGVRKNTHEINSKMPLCRAITQLFLRHGVFSTFSRVGIMDQVGEIFLLGATFSQHYSGFIRNSDLVAFLTDLYQGLFLRHITWVGFCRVVT